MSKPSIWRHKVHKYSPNRRDHLVFGDSELCISLIIFLRAAPVAKPVYFSDQFWPSSYNRNPETVFAVSNPLTGPDHTSLSPFGHFLRPQEFSPYDMNFSHFPVSKQHKKVLKLPL
jgi:hypothetical protein